MEGDKTLQHQAYNHTSLQEVFSAINLNFLHSNYFAYTINKEKEIDFKLLRKAVWLCSILANSDIEAHRIRAQRFASLLYLTNAEKKENTYIIGLCYILFSRIGNLTATRFFKELISDANSTESPFPFLGYDGLLSLELSLQRQHNTISTDTGSVLLTSFQKKLWNGLNETSNLAVSAPTSSGKSFIIKQYLAEVFFIRNTYKALFVVPSRALINQVSEEFRIELRNSNTLIRTAFIGNDDEKPEKEEAFLKEVYREPKVLYILTPERCIKLLTADLESKIKLDFIFIDEIQGVEDEQGRGATFENVFEDLSIQFPKAQLITAGPHILNPEKTYNELFGRVAKSFVTQLSPVIQFKKIIRSSDSQNIEVEVRDGINKPFFLEAETNFNAETLFKNGTNGNILQRIINLVAPENSNLIYSNRGDYAEKWAQEYQESIDEMEIPERVRELIEFLKDEFHKDYLLIECLEKGVAFHHGKLPDIIRKEVEELFQDREINNLFCTSTLIEGVNLPANNLFIITPRKNLDDLTDFEFGNLIGRAGRLSESLFGTIYFIEKPDHKGKLPSEYFDADYEKEITTYSTKNIPQYNFAYLGLNINDIEVLSEDGKIDKNGTYQQKQLTLFIRNRYIKNPENIDYYLTGKGVPELLIQDHIQTLEQTLNSLEVPRKINIENQSIDPILQNELYLKVKNGDISNWVITPNSILEKRRRREDVEDKPNSDRPFFWQLLTIFQGLENIFSLSQEAFERYSIINMNPTVLAIHATTWLQGLSYKQLIDNDIKFYATDNRVLPEERLDPNDKYQVNKLINKIIKINSSVVTYLLVKYTKLLVDVLDSILTEEEKEKYKITMGLPTALELGTRDKDVRNLISGGISRSVAISVSKKYKQLTTHEYREANTITYWLSTKNTINGLKPIYNRYLKRLKLLKEDNKQ
ncbi:DEAD/DEAH box helicase [Leeuwenhoekiella sp. A16]|uniref:DEAD/DEAH box helicase n=1 Tax=unclassified Leeuwenhoekiella TaxID=2615029 RepID=UPI003A7F85AE